MDGRSSKNLVGVVFVFMEQINQECITKLKTMLNEKFILKIMSQIGKSKVPSKNNYEVAELNLEFDAWGDWLKRNNIVQSSEEEIENHIKVDAVANLGWFGNLEAKRQQIKEHYFVPVDFANKALALGYLPD